MAYAASGLNLLAQGVGDAPSLWTYTSTDIHTTVDGTDYFSDGDARGLKVGDVMFVNKSDATKGTTIHYVGTVTAGGAATIEPAILA